MNKLTINNIDVTSCAEVQDLELVWGFNSETQTVTFGSITGLEIIGEGADIIKQDFFDSCFGETKAQLYLECCKKTFDFIIEKEKTQYCANKCKVTVELVADDKSLRAYDCLDSEIALSDNFLKSQNHLLFRQPEASIFTGGLAGLIGQSTSVLSANDIQGFNVPEGFWSGYLVREILQYHAQRCGLELCAPIFAPPQIPEAFGDYYNLAIIPKGWQTDTIPPENNVNLGQSNTDTFPEFLNRLAKVFPNHEWVIIDCKLYFDTKENIANLQTAVIDLTAENVLTESEICYEVAETNNCAYSRFQWGTDQGDGLSRGKTYQRFFKNLIEHNPNGANENLTGECSYINDFAMANGVSGAGISGQVGLVYIANREIFTDRLVIWDGNNKNDARMESTNCPPFNQVLNCQLTVNDEINNNNNLLRFVDNPNGAEGCRFRLSDFCALVPTPCDVIESLLKYGAAVNIKTAEGVFKVDPTEGQISYNTATKLLCVSNILS